MYAKLEEDFGLSRHAMAVYERAVKSVPKNEMYEVSYSGNLFLSNKQLLISSRLCECTFTLVRNPLDSTEQNVFVNVYCYLDIFYIYIFSGIKTTETP